MEKREILCSSFTYAMKGKKYLEKKGIFSTVEKNANGCGCLFSIKLNEKDYYDSLLSELSAQGIKLHTTN